MRRYARLPAPLAAGETASIPRTGAKRLYIFEKLRHATGSGLGGHDFAVVQKACEKSRLGQALIQRVDLPPCEPIRGFGKLGLQFENVVLPVGRHTETERIRFSDGLDVTI